jgi:hypothetical protein
MRQEQDSWSEEELSLLASGLSNPEVAKQTGRSQPAVRAKRQRLAKKFKKSFKAKDSREVPSPTSESPYHEDKAQASANFWKKQHDALKSKYQKSLREQAASERLIQMATELAPKSYNPAPACASVTPSRGRSQSALLFLSDTHVGQVVLPEQTMGFGEYNFEMFLARLKHYEEAVSSILRDHTTTKLNELVIAMGGDMLHGALNHGAEAGQQHTLFQQFYGAGHAFAQFVRNLSALVPKVRIHRKSVQQP